MTDDKALKQAYLDTIYRVASEPQPIDICIGEPNAALEYFLRANGVRAWAFLTASNPRSKPLSDVDNALRNTAMRSSLEKAGWRTVDGVGLPARGDWQPEDSVLVLGIDRDSATTLARRWQQNAFVYGELGGLPKLLWVK